MSTLPPVTIRLTDAEYRQIEREALPRPRKTAGQWRQEVDNLFDALQAAEEQAFWLGELLAVALILLDRRAKQHARTLELVDVIVTLDNLIIERTAAT